MEEVYEIKDWNKHFENSESRKIKSLTWVPVKNRHDGKGYRRVCQHPKSIQIFCAWNLILQVASKMPVRGLLRDDDGPLTTSDLADKTGYPEHIFKAAFEVLPDPKIGWLVKTSRPIPKHPDASGNAGVEGNRREQKGTEQTSPPQHSKSKVLERGVGENHVADEAREIPTAEQAVAMTMTCGIPEDFTRYVYRTWFGRSGKDAANVPVEFLKYVTGRWVNEQNEWRSGQHRGNKKTSLMHRETRENITVEML